MSGRRAFLGRLAAAIAGGAWLSKGAPASATVDETPIIGEIRLFGGLNAPTGWALCNGQLRDPNVDFALFNLIGTTYGGDGVSTFALPDLRGRAPIHQGTFYNMGQVSGSETVSLAVSSIPGHSHAAMAGSAVGSSDDPTGRAPAGNAAGSLQYATTPDVSLSTNSLTSTGGGAPHNNMQPFLAMTFIIALEGIYPSQS